MSGLRHFRSLDSDEVAHQIACSSVGSRLDDLTTVTRCYSTVPTETLTSCSACRIIWRMSFATLDA